MNDFDAWQISRWQGIGDSKLNLASTGFLPQEEPENGETAQFGNVRCEGNCREAREYFKRHHTNIPGTLEASH